MSKRELFEYYYVILKFTTLKNYLYYPEFETFCCGNEKSF